MSLCRILLDECLPTALAQGLRLRSRTTPVLRVGDAGAPPYSIDDPDLLIWCEESRCILVSGDRATLPDFVIEHLRSGHHTYGVFVVRPGRRLGDVLDDLELIIEASDSEEWFDRFEYLPMFS